MKCPFCNTEVEYINETLLKCKCGYIGVVRIGSLTTNGE